MSNNGTIDLSMGKIIYLRQEKTTDTNAHSHLARTYQAKLAQMDDSSEMLAYIQMNLPKDLPKGTLAQFKLDLTFDSTRRLHLLYVLSTPFAAGLPITFAGPCAKSVLYGCMEWLVKIKPRKNCQVDPIDGIIPHYITPIPLFEKRKGVPR